MIRPSPDLDDFISKNKRFPHLGDPVPPWEYPGWLLRYVVMHNRHNEGVPDRWGYLLRTLEARQLLDEPIPRIKFGAPDRSVFSSLDQWVRVPNWDVGGWSDFRTLVEWLSFGLQLRDNLPDLSPDKHERLYREVNIVPMLETPYDYLGQWISERKGNGWNPGAFFPTPHPVVECMVEVCYFDVGNEEDGRGGKDPRVLSVCDPCVGTGRMLLHASNHSMNLFGQDIDPLLCQVAMVNAALYAPWIVCPLPEEILETGMPREKEHPRRKRREKVATVTQVADLLDEAGRRSDLGTDGFVRVAMHLLRQAGFSPTAYQGTARWKGRHLPCHLWLEVGPFVVDYRLRRHLGPDAPHGVFRVVDREGLAYSGKVVRLEAGDTMLRVILGGE